MNNSERQPDGFMSEEEARLDARGITSDISTPQERSAQPQEATPFDSARVKVLKDAIVVIAKKRQLLGPNEEWGVRSDGSRIPGQRIEFWEDELKFEGVLDPKKPADRREIQKALFELEQGADAKEQRGGKEKELDGDRDGTDGGRAVA